MSQASNTVGVAAAVDSPQAIVRLSDSSMESTGAVVSRKVISCVAELELPQVSVAVHTRCRRYAPAQLPGSTVSLRLTPALPPQAPSAVTPGTGAASLQVRVRSAGTFTSWGASVPVTSIRWNSSFALPQASVAVQVRSRV